MPNLSTHIDRVIIILYPSTYRTRTVIHLLQIQQSHSSSGTHGLVRCDVQVYPHLKYA